MREKMSYEEFKQHMQAGYIDAPADIEALRLIALGNYTSDNPDDVRATGMTSEDIELAERIGNDLWMKYADKLADELALREMKIKGVKINITMTQEDADALSHTAKPGFVKDVKQQLYRFSEVIGKISTNDDEKCMFFWTDGLAEAVLLRLYYLSGGCKAYILWDENNGEYVVVLVKE